ncbi:hypothetical protein AAFP30_08410 [Gordonia sp. CPCC 205515]|uniref:hypothetical protein n=1 Tax=Gordonia sp. CPCC 205515 TaxID=3140791 RepID=UPI003AF3A474
MAVATPILMTIIGNTTNVWIAFSRKLVGLLILSCRTALAAIVKAELFPTRVRALGVGLRTRWCRQCSRAGDIDRHCSVTSDGCCLREVAVEPIQPAGSSSGRASRVAGGPLRCLTPGDDHPILVRQHDEL